MLALQAAERPPEIESPENPYRKIRIHPNESVARGTAFWR